MPFTGALGTSDSQLGQIELGAAPKTPPARLYASPAGLGSFLLFGAGPISFIGGRTAGEAVGRAIAVNLTSPTSPIAGATSAESVVYASVVGRGPIAASTMAQATSLAAAVGVGAIHAQTSSEARLAATVTGLGILQAQGSGQARTAVLVYGQGIVRAAMVGEVSDVASIAALVVIAAHGFGQATEHASIVGVVHLSAATSASASTRALILGLGFLRLETVGQATARALFVSHDLHAQTVGESPAFASIVGVAHLTAHTSAEATARGDASIHRFILGFAVAETSSHVVLTGQGVLEPRTAGESSAISIAFGAGFIGAVVASESTAHIFLGRVPYSTSTKLLFVHFERSNVQRIRFWEPIRELNLNDPMIRRLVMGGPRPDEDGILRRMPTTADREMPRGDTLFFLDSVWQDVATQQVFSVPITNPTTPPPPGSVPFNLSGSHIICTVKKYVPDPDQAAVMQMDNAAIGGVAIISAVQGTFSVTGPALSTIQFADSEVTLLIDIQLKTVGGNIITIERGKLFVLPDITRAES